MPIKIIKIIIQNKVRSTLFVLFNYTLLRLTKQAIHTKVDTSPESLQPNTQVGFSDIRIS